MAKPRMKVNEIKELIIQLLNKVDNATVEDFSHQIQYWNEETEEDSDVPSGYIRLNFCPDPQEIKDEKVS